MAFSMFGHDASGVSKDQYEEQLNELRQENCNLMLRIHFLEERLGKAPPALQEVLKHNVMLQVEVEELKRQLSDKQELLVEAAEAIDILEQQIADRKDATYNICAESESAGDCMAGTVNNDDSDELMKLRKENHKALQMIKGCLKKIQQQDKAMKSKLDKELTYAQVSDSQLEKYQELLKCKDEHIKSLETKLRDLQKDIENVQNEAFLA